MSATRSRSALAAQDPGDPSARWKATAAALGAVPEDLAALRTTQRAGVLDERDLKPCINALVEAVQGRPFEEIAEDLARRIRSARRARLAGVAIGLVVFLAASVALLDLLTLDTRFASLTMWLGGLGTAPQRQRRRVDGDHRRRDREAHRPEVRPHVATRARAARRPPLPRRERARSPSTSRSGRPCARKTSGSPMRSRAPGSARPRSWSPCSRPSRTERPARRSPSRTVLGKRVDRREEHGWGIACLGEKLGLAPAQEQVPVLGLHVHVVGWSV